MEETTRLIEVGAYRYIRHPLYATMILGGVGAGLKELSWVSAACVLVVLVSAYLTAKVEEGEMLRKFADDYAAYMTRTRMFIHFLF
jgi:protein-S-isoprenylcysteine O-methyltransferase Ste14